MTEPDHPGWLDVPDWRQHQNYADEKVLWIKLHASVLLTPSTRNLSLACKGLLFSTWVLLASSGFRVEADHVKLSKLTGSTVRREHLKALCDAGLLLIVDEPPDMKSRPAPRARAHAKERREEKTTTTSSSFSEDARTRATDGAAARERDEEPAGDEADPLSHLAYEPDLPRLAQLMHEAAMHAEHDRRLAAGADLADVELTAAVAREAARQRQDGNNGAS